MKRRLIWELALLVLLGLVAVAMYLGYSGFFEQFPPWRKYATA